MKTGDTILNGGTAGMDAMAAGVSNAIKACGPIVTVDGRTFRKLISVIDDPLVVAAESKLFGTRHHYLTAFKGLTFYAKEKTPLQLPDGIALIRAKRISIPDF